MDLISLVKPVPVIVSEVPESVNPVIMAVGAT